MIKIYNSIVLAIVRCSAMIYTPWEVENMYPLLQSKQPILLALQLLRDYKFHSITVQRFTMSHILITANQIQYVYPPSPIGIVMNCQILVTASSVLCTARSVYFEGQGHLCCIQALRWHHWLIFN